MNDVSSTHSVFDATRNPQHRLRPRHTPGRPVPGWVASVESLDGSCLCTSSTIVEGVEVKKKYKETQSSNSEEHRREIKVPSLPPHTSGGNGETIGCGITSSRTVPDLRTGPVRGTVTSCLEEETAETLQLPFVCPQGRSRGSGSRLGSTRDVTCRDPPTGVPRRGHYSRVRP